MSPKSRELYALIRQVRTCFHLLKNLGDELIGDLDINASMRAVMESLNEDGPQPVPDIARSKNVSRQHIQVNMDALLSKGLVASHDNPMHKRSPLYDLTAQGGVVFSEVLRREAAILARLSHAVGEKNVHAGEKALAVLNGQLNQELDKGYNHDEE